MKSFSLILLAAALTQAAPLFKPCDTSSALAGTAGPLTFCTRQTDLKPYARRSIIARQDDNFGDDSGDNSGDDSFGGDDSGGVDAGADDSADSSADSPDDSGFDDGGLDTSAADGSADAGDNGDDGSLDTTDDGTAGANNGADDTTGLDEGTDGTDDGLDNGTDDGIDPAAGAADGTDTTDSTDSTDGTDNTDGTDSTDATAPDADSTDPSDVTGASNSTDTSDTSGTDNSTDSADGATNSTTAATPSADSAASPAANTAAPAAAAPPAPNANGQCAQGATPPNAATISLIKSFEGFVASPKPDPIGLPTAGFGHKCVKANCAEVPFSFPLSQDTATQLLQSDAQKFVTCLHGMIGKQVTLNDNQFGALTSFAFNLGCGTVQSSTLLKRLNNGEDPNTVAAAEIPRFNKAGGKVSSGLARRRAAEVQLFQTPSSTVAQPLC